LYRLIESAAPRIGDFAAFASWYSLPSLVQFSPTIAAFAAKLCGKSRAFRFAQNA
jgi:hypothetical protein